MLDKRCRIWYNIRDVALLFIAGWMDNDVRMGREGRVSSPFLLPEN